MEQPHSANNFIWVIHVVIDGFVGVGRHANKQAAIMLAKNEARTTKELVLANRRTAASANSHSSSRSSDEERRIIELSKRRGLRTEKLVFDAFDAGSDDAPFWFRGVHPPSLAQDMRQKIDIIVVTHDPAEIYIQIKSSRAGLETFLKSNPPKNIECVVVYPSDSLPKIRGKVYAAANKQRRRLGLPETDPTLSQPQRIKVIEALPLPKHIPKRQLRSKTGGT